MQDKQTFSAPVKCKRAISYLIFICPIARYLFNQASEITFARHSFGVRFAASSNSLLLCHKCDLVLPPWFHQYILPFHFLQSMVLKNFDQRLHGLMSSNCLWARYDKIAKLEQLRTRRHLCIDFSHHFVNENVWTNLIHVDFRFFSCLKTTAPVLPDNTLTFRTPSV